MDKRYFPEKLARWYETNKRRLPWRATQDPYLIWLAEVILQQTRVNQGLPYYEAFVRAFPTVRDLASARERDVLRLWQGLGYYTRARNLHKCARLVSEVYGGTFPGNAAELIKLPGVGDYTAAAIASFAYRERVAAVDGNVFRALSRIFGIDTPINSSEGKKVFTSLANELISHDRPDVHNQALMEFGATVCTPKSPRCHECIFQKSCQAYVSDLQDVLPLKQAKKASRKRHFYYLVFERGSNLLMRKRAAGDIWTGLYDFYLVEKSRPVSAERVLDEFQAFALNRKQAVRITKTYRHVLTHQTIFSTFIMVRTDKVMISGLKNHAFYSLGQIGRLPKPALVSRFLDDHYLS